MDIYGTKTYFKFISKKKAIETAKICLVVYPFQPRFLSDTLQHYKARPLKIVRSSFSWTI